MAADDTSRDDMGDPIKHCERCGREVYYGSRCPRPCTAQGTFPEALIERIEELLMDERDKHPRVHNDAPSADLAEAVVDAVVLPLVQERDRLAAELAVDVKHQRMDAEGRDCPVCTHMTHESAYDELDAAIKRAEVAEAALHAARATRDVFVRAVIQG